MQLLLFRFTFSFLVFSQFFVNFCCRCLTLAVARPFGTRLSPLAALSLSTRSLASPCILFARLASLVRPRFAFSVLFLLLFAAVLPVQVF